MKNKILAVIRKTIPYVKELRPITGSLSASILMQQLDFYFNQYPDGFYKFLEPCNNEYYKKGDSWCEELCFGVDEFRSAFDKIGIRYKSKSEFKESTDKFNGKFYASYVSKMDHKTYYVRNHNLVDSALDTIVYMAIPGTGETQYRGVGNPNTVVLGNSIPYIDDTEITTEITTESKRNNKEKIISEPIKKPKEPKLTFEEFSSTEFPDYIDTELMHEYFKHRKSKMTKFALKLLLGNLSKAHSDGIDVNEALKSSIISGWDGVFPKGNKPKSNGKTNDKYNNFKDNKYSEEEWWSK